MPMLISGLTRKIFLLIIFLYLLIGVVGGQQSKDEQRDEQFEIRRKNFDSGRKLLLDKGLSFEPEELLRDNWTKQLKDRLENMPEWHQVRRETRPLKGVYIADTLYLPEKTQIAGHTFIL